MTRATPNRIYRFYVATAIVVLAAPLLSPAAEVLVPERAPGVYSPGRVRGAAVAAARSLRTITPATVGRLEVAWTYRTGDVSAHVDGRAGTAFEATPVLDDGTLYFPTPFSRVIALDAATGTERWTFDPVLDRSDTSHTMVTSRGVAVWRDAAAAAGTPCRVRVFAAAYDARLFALDAATGEPCQDFGERGRIDLKDGVARIEGRESNYKTAPPPTVVHDLVVMGSTIYDNREADAPSGVVRAFDARSGALRWAWDPVAGVGGYDTAGQWVAAGAANAWATMRADEQRDLIFVPTSSASPDHYGGLRPGSNLYANSIVALRATTGAVVWHFQTVHHDLWDYDLAAPPALINVHRDGVAVPAVVVGTKLGYLFVLDRETGAPLFPIEELPVPASDVPGEATWPTQPIPLLPRPLSPQGFTPDEAWGLTPLDRGACRARLEQLRHDGVFAPPSLRGTVAMPGFLGGLQWGGPGWDESRQLLVVNAVHIAMVATLIPRHGEEDARRASQADGRSQIGGQARTPYAVRREPLLSPLGIPCNPPPWGTLAAVDMVSGEVRWEVPLGTMPDLVHVPTPRPWGSPNLGGPVVAGGLAFIAATMDRRIRAFDILTGRRVWEDELPASAQATPLLYDSPADGRQMLVIAAGGHAQLGSALGDYVIAYALPTVTGPEPR